MTKRKQFLIYSAAFVIVFLGAFCGLYLNGKSFVWQGDGFRQYYPALQYLGRYYRTIVSGLLHGDFSFSMIDYSIGQGEDIITTFCNYGLGDPFPFLPYFLQEKRAWRFSMRCWSPCVCTVQGLLFCAFQMVKSGKEETLFLVPFYMCFVGLPCGRSKIRFFSME